MKLNIVLLSDCGKVISDNYLSRQVFLIVVNQKNFVIIDTDGKKLHHGLVVASRMHGRAVRLHYRAATKLRPGK